MKQYRINYLYLTNSGNYDVRREFYNNEVHLKEHYEALRRNKNVFDIQIWERDISQWDISKIQPVQQ